MAHHKLTLPQKTCPICLRLFAWRKKWKKNWQEVIYCSERCSRNKVKSGNVETLENVNTLKSLGKP